MLDADEDAEPVTTVMSLSAPNMRRRMKMHTSRITPTHIRKRVGRDVASAGGADIALCARALRDVGDEGRG
jgi:hypothetical protein